MSHLDSFMQNILGNLHVWVDMFYVYILKNSMLLKIIVHTRLLNEISSENGP